MANKIKYAFFILKDFTLVKVPFTGDLITTTKSCEDMYGEVGYLDAVENM